MNRLGVTAKRIAQEMQAKTVKSITKRDVWNIIQRIHKKECITGDHSYGFAEDCGEHSSTTVVKIGKSVIAKESCDKLAHKLAEVKEEDMLNFYIGMIERFEEMVTSGGRFQITGDWESFLGELTHGDVGASSSGQIDQPLSRVKRGRLKGLSKTSKAVGKETSIRFLGSIMDMPTPVTAPIVTKYKERIHNATNE